MCLWIKSKVTRFFCIRSWKHRLFFEKECAKKTILIRFSRIWIVAAIQLSNVKISIRFVWWSYNYTDDINESPILWWNHWLIKDGIEIKHYILYAEKKTLEKRLNKRLEWGNSWAKSQIDRCIHAFNHEITEEKIITDLKTFDSIVEEIAEKSGVPLLNDKRWSIRKKLDRAITLLKHIR